MKKVFLFAGLTVLAFALTNCSRQDIEAPAVPEKYSIRLTEPQTKTANDGMSTVWAEGDALAVFFAPTGSTQYSDNFKFDVTDPEIGVAEGDATLADGTYDLYAFYPYSERLLSPDNSGSEPFYQALGSTKAGFQRQDGYGSMAHLSGKNLPLFGIVTGIDPKDGPTVPMHHLTTAVAINVTNNTGAEVTLTSAELTAPEDIVGTYYIDFSSETPAFASSGESYTGPTAHLLVENGTPLAPGETATLYMAMKPFSLDGDLILKVTTSEGSQEKTASVTTEFAAGHIKTLNFSLEELEEVQDAIEVSIAEFNAAEDSKEQPYRLTGKITEIKNATFGNFNMEDETGSVYVYGLVAEDKGYDANYANDKTFSSLGLKVGDVVTLIGYKLTYGETIEVVASYYVSHEPYVAPANPDAEGSGTESDPYNIAGVIDYIDGIGQTTSTEDVYVKGIISKIVYPFDAEHQTGTFWISDDGEYYGDNTKDFEAYSVYWLDNQPWVDGNDQPAVGDEVVLCGKVTYYKKNSVYETSSRNAYVYSYVQNSTPVEDDFTTLSVTITEYAEAHDCAISSGNDVTCYTILALSDAIRMTTSGNPNCGSIWGTDKKDWRLYQNQDGDVAIRAASGCELKSVKFTYSATNNGTLLDGSTQVASGTEYEVSGTVATFTVGNTGDKLNGQVRISAVEVKYTGDGSFGDLDETVEGTLTLTPKNSVIHVGETLQLTAASNSGAAVVFESSDESVATVDADGLVEALAVGEVTITGYLEAVDGKFTEAEATCTIKVEEALEELDGTWVLTDLDAISEGDEFVIVSTGANGSFAMTNDNGSSKAPAAASVTVSGSELVSVASNMAWTLEVSGDGYIFHPAGDTEACLYGFDSNNGVRVGTSDANVWVPQEDGYLTITIAKEGADPVTRYLGVYNSQDWRIYTSINNNIKDQTFTFYVKQ